MNIRKWWRSFKSAITGRYVTEDAAREHPESTFSQKHPRVRTHSEPVKPRTSGESYIVPPKDGV